MDRNKIHIYRYENIMKPIIRENEYATTKLKNKVGIPIISFKNQKKFSFVIRGRQMIHIHPKIPFVNRWQRSLPVVQIHPNRVAQISVEILQEPYLILLSISISLS